MEMYNTSAEQQSLYDIYGKKALLEKQYHTSLELLQYKKELEKEIYDGTNKKLRKMFRKSFTNRKEQFYKKALKSVKTECYILYQKQSIGQTNNNIFYQFQYTKIIDLLESILSIYREKRKEKKNIKWILNTLDLDY